MTDGRSMSVSSHGSSERGKVHNVSVTGLTEEESEILQACIRQGHHWIRRGEAGRLEHRPCLEELPGPIVDTAMFPYWRRPTEVETRQQDLFGFDEPTRDSIKHSSPSITITSLCGYNYSEENYEREAEKLLDWGFVCLRSQRDANSGRYWEIWHLPGVWMAKGKLEEAIRHGKAESEAKDVDLAIKFLRRHSSFGSLDVSVQRLAMVIDD